MAGERADGESSGSAPAEAGECARLEALAEQSKRQLRDAIETLADGFVLYDEDDRLVLCNQRYREIYALSAPALVPGTRFEDILRFGLRHGQYADAVGREEAWLKERLRAHRRASSVIEQHLPDDRWLRIIERTTPDGGRVGLRIDITELKRQERRLADIIAGTNVGTWEWNVQTGETRFNERWAEIIGLTLDDISPTTIRTWMHYCHPEDLARSEALLQRHFAGETAFYEWEARMRHKAGHWVWVLDRGRVASWTADGLPEWMSGTHQDITAQKAAQARLESSHDRLDQLLQSAPTMIYAADAKTWQPTYVSGNCVDFFGYSAAEILAWPTWWQDHLHPDDRERAMAEPLGWFAAGADGPWRHTYRIRRADGRYIWVIDQLRALRDAAGEITEIVGSHVDITERKRLEQRLEAEHAFLEQIMATSVSAIVVLDGEGRIRFANDEAERVLGISAQRVGERRYEDPEWRITELDGSDFPADRLPFARVTATGRPVQDIRHAIVWPDGSRRFLSVNAAPLPAAADSAGRVVCSVTDITERLEAKSALEQNEALLRGLFELCPVGIALNDFATGRFLEVNDALLAPTGYSRAEFLQLSYLDVTPEPNHPLEAAARRSLLENGRYGPLEKEYRRKDGTRYPVLLNGILVEDRDGTPLIWSIVEDISERKAHEARMLAQAQHDPLTGLANRRLFGDRLGAALERARRRGGAGAVLMLDLDHFKPVNDSLGHGAGDAILIEAARRLTASTRKTDTVARFGGDEFVILLDGIAETTAVEAIAGTIRAALKRPFRVEGREVELSLTIGIACFPADSCDPDETVRLADAAMYRAKRSGRDAIALHRHGSELPIRAAASGSAVQAGPADRMATTGT